MSPDDDTLVGALRVLRVHYPSLGRTKVIEKFRSERDWQIGDKRMKAIMDANNLCAIDPREVELAKQMKKMEKQKLSYIPPKALKEQLSFNKRTKGCLILYGNGEWDYQVTIISEMCSRTQSNLKCMANFLKIFENKRMPAPRQEYLVNQGYCVEIWEMYKAAAEHINKAEDHEMNCDMIRRQFIAEYRVDPFLSEDPDPERAAILKERHAQQYKKFQMARLRDLYKTQPELVPVDAKEEPIWDDVIYSQWAVTILAIHREGIERNKRLL